VSVPEHHHMEACESAAVMLRGMLTFALYRVERSASSSIRCIEEGPGFCMIDWMGSGAYLGAMVMKSILPLAGGISV
jgi:hypothetical protein